MSRPARFPETLKIALPSGALASLDKVLRPNELRQDAVREAIVDLLKRRWKLPRRRTMEGQRQ